MSIGTRSIEASLQVHGGKVALGDLPLQATDFENPAATVEVKVAEPTLGFEFGRFFVRQVSLVYG